MRRRLRPGVRGRAVRADRVARRRLPPVRDRPLHRRPRLVRRAVGEQLPVRPPQAARAGRRLRRGLLDRRRRLHQPRALRAARRRRPTSRSSTHPRRGLVPPGARRHDHQPGRPRRAARAGVRSTASAYAELRGRPFSGPEKPIHYVGGFHDRRRPKRSRARAHDRRGVRGRPRARGRLDGPAARRCPSPTSSATASSTRTGAACAWQRHDVARASRVPNAPTDLLDLPGDHRRGPARLDHRDRHPRRRPGPLPRVGLRPARPRPGRLRRQRCQASDLPEHPRVTYIVGTAHGRRRPSRPGPRSSSATTPKGLVILGTRGPRQTHAHASSRPTRRLRRRSARTSSWSTPCSTATRSEPRFGPGPHEAVRRILNLHGDFVADTELEKYSLTFNPGGFLRRQSDEPDR